MSDAAGIDIAASLRSRVALAFIVKDEGRYALDMLKFVASIVGFVSCVDTGSSDDTISLITDLLYSYCLRHSITSVEFTRFDQLRNLSIENVPSEFDWILVLDADEIILERDFIQLWGLVNQDQTDAWFVPRANWVGSIGHRTENYPDFQGRLFRHYPDKRIRFSRSIHEVLSGYVNAEACPTDEVNYTTFHIHHLKLLKKSMNELLERESLYGAVMRANIRSDVLSKIWFGEDPFINPERSAGREDLQGWGSAHPFLTEAIDEIRPNIVVEIGVWKGGSTITMAGHMKERGLSGVVIAVDTWLGSSDHWLQREWFTSLKISDGYPTLYRTFVANVVSKDLCNFIVPLPTDSMNAAEILRLREIFPDVVHIDAGHDYASVTNDLRAWWSLLRPGGLLIGDDYDPNGGAWPEVKRAFEDFFVGLGIEIESRDAKCRIRKMSK